MFLKISQISVETPTLQALRPATNFIKKRLQHEIFLIKFLKTPFSEERLWRLLFKIRNSNNQSISDIS